MVRRLVGARRVPVRGGVLKMRRVRQRNGGRGYRHKRGNDAVL